MKKRLLMVILSALFCFAITSCNKDKNPNSGQSYVITERDGVIFHYSRADNDYSTFSAIWVWPKGGEGHEYNFEYSDDYGKVAVVHMDLTNVTEVGFIVKKPNEWKKDIEKDRFAVLESYDRDSDGYYHVYLRGGDENIYTSANLTITPGVVDFKIKELGSGKYAITFTLTTEALSWEIKKNGSSLITSSTAKDNDGVFMFDEKTYLKEITFRLGDKLPSFEDNYTLHAEFNDSKSVEASADMSSLYYTDEFKSLYTYTGDLGAIYSKTSTTFRVWTPLSTKMVLRIYDNGTPKSVDSTKGSDSYTEYEMVRGVNGTWETNVSGDLDGKYYTYVVTNYKYKDREVVDPYAKSTGVNGKRGMVVNFERINQELGWDSFEINHYKPQELTVYETHITDLTSSETWSSDAEAKKLAKTYKGFYLEGTTYTSGNTTVKTGFDHVKELGVNAVQIIPIFDSDNDEVNRSFNWGYNPLNYNALDGSYSTNPYDGYEKIKEFKSLVKTYTEAGINIIMDVVYNHVMSADGSNFDVLMPKYYFRYENGVLSNGSGCGNETASNAPMFHKFMIDSTEFWAKEYKLGGFRFDLMGIHDLETMDELSTNLHKNVSEYVTVYGEPWSGGSVAYPSNWLANQSNLPEYTEYGGFNDKLRDALIKGGLNSSDAKGWVTATEKTKNEVKSEDIENLVNGVASFVLLPPKYYVCEDVTSDNFQSKVAKGLYVLDSDRYVKLTTVSTFDSNAKYYTRNATNTPEQCVNYVTCHDNYTLWDRIGAAGITDEALKKKMAVLANSVVFTSQGITFMLAGEEFLRTKGGDSNSYQSSYKVNELDYSLKAKNQDVFGIYQKLIALKHNEDLLGLDSSRCDAFSKNVTISSDNSMLSYKWSYVKNGVKYEYYVIHRNGTSSEDLKVNLAGYTLYLDTLNTNKALTDDYSVSNYQTIIAYKTINLG